MKNLLPLLCLLTTLSASAATNTLTTGRFAGDLGGILTSNLLAANLVQASNTYDVATAYIRGDLSTITDSDGFPADASSATNTPYHIKSTQPLVMTNSSIWFWFWATNNVSIGGPAWTLSDTLDAATYDVGYSQSLGTNGSTPAASDFLDGNGNSLSDNIAQFKTNIAYHPFAILTISDVATILQSITNGGVLNNVTIKGSYLTNNTYTQMTGRPTNIYVLTGNISGTINTHKLTVSSGSFSGIRAGDSFAITWSNRTEQVTVGQVVSSSEVRVLEYLNNTYSTATNKVTVYPSLMYITDITTRPAAWIESDGSFAIIGPAADNSAAFKIVDGYEKSGTNWTFRMAGGDNSFNLYNLAGAAQGNPFMIDADANYESIHVRRKGYVDAQFGILSRTNNLVNPSAITPTGSPFSFTNTTVVNGFVVIDGSVAFSATWNATTVQSSLAGGVTIPLQPGEYTTVTYTVAPGMFFKPF